MRRADGPKEVADAERHVSKHMSFLEKLSDDKKKECRRLALHAARLFLLSCSVLEQAALVQHPDKWNSKVDLKHQHTAAKAFAKGGGSKRLKAWLVEVAQDNIKKSKGRKKVATADGSSGDGLHSASGSYQSPASSASSPSPDAGSSHSGSTSQDKSAKKKKKEKKCRPAAKAKRAGKKDKSKKAKKSRSADRKKRRRSSSSPAPPTAPKKKTPAAEEAFPAMDDSESPQPEEVQEALTAAQEDAFADWQLSEIQSAAGEWEEFANSNGTLEEFKKVYGLLPESARAAFNLKLKVERTKLPRNLPDVVARAQKILTLGVAIWQKGWWRAGAEGH